MESRNHKFFNKNAVKVSGGLSLCARKQARSGEFKLLLHDAAGQGEDQGEVQGAHTLWPSPSWSSGWTVHPCQQETGEKRPFQPVLQDDVVLRRGSDRECEQ